MSGATQRPPAPYDCPKCGQVHQRACKGHKPDGAPCGNWPRKGTVVNGSGVCTFHGGNAPQVMRRAAVREAVMSWGLDDQVEDPGLLMLRLVAQSKRRADLYSAEVQRMVAVTAERDGDKGTLERALTATKFAASETGSPVPIGEYTREMVKLESEERDRAMNYAKVAFHAGLTERQVKLAEQFGSAMAGMVQRAMDRAAIPVEARLRTMEALGAELEAFMGGHPIVDGELAA